VALVRRPVVSKDTIATGPAQTELRALTTLVIRAGPAKDILAAGPAKDILAAGPAKDIRVAGPAKDIPVLLPAADTRVEAAGEHLAPGNSYESGGLDFASRPPFSWAGQSTMEKPRLCLTC
jgi:hypothetical protein